MSGNEKAMDSNMNRHGRTKTGSVLVGVVVILSVVLSVVLFASVGVSGRTRIVRDRLRREAAYDRLVAVIGEGVAALAADTNRVDSLDEPWARPVEELGTNLWSDAGSRIGLDHAATNDLVVVLAGAEADSREMDAVSLAESLVKTREAWKEAHGRVPDSFGPYLSAEGMTDVYGKRLQEVCTPVGAEKCNINTVGEKVLAVLLEICGAPPDMVRDMLRNVRKFRETGVPVRAPGRESLETLLLGEGALPTKEEARVVEALSRRVGVESRIFSASAMKDGAGVECVWDREEGRFLEWSVW